jgi:hypothetical protein
MRAQAHDYGTNKISKTLLDPAVSLTRIWWVPIIHRPIVSVCTQRKLHIRTHSSLLVVII